MEAGDKAGDEGFKGLKSPELIILHFIYFFFFFYNTIKDLFIFKSAEFTHPFESFNRCH